MIIQKRLNIEKELTFKERTDCVTSIRTESMLRTVLDDTRMSEVINVDDMSETGIVILGCQRTRIYRKLEQKGEP